MSKFIGGKATKERYENNVPYKQKIESEDYKFNNETLDDIIKEIPENGAFLDAGCATAPFLAQLISRAKTLNRSDIKFFAFDFSKDYIKTAKAKNLGAEIFEDDLLKLNSEHLKDKKFDYIFSKDVLFFIETEKRELAFANLKNLLKPEGTLKIWIREKKEGVQDPKFNDFTQDEFQECLVEAGFEIENIGIGQKISYGKKDEENQFRRMFAIAKSKELKLKNNPSSPSLDSNFNNNDKQPHI